MTPTRAFIGILILCLSVRLGLALTWDGYLGVDGGAYAVGLLELLTGKHYLPAFPRPPLAPGLLLWPFTAAFGLDVGYKLWTVLFSIFPLVPVYLLARKYAGEWSAVFGAGFCALDWFHSEMTVTGSLPLIGFGLIGLAWWSMANLAEDFSKKQAIILTLSIGLIPWINQTSAGLAIIVLPAYWLALFVFQRTWFDRSGVVWHIVPFALLGGVLALGALPWYTKTLPGSSILSFGGPMFYLAGWWPVWIQAAIAWGLGIFLLRKSSEPGMKTLAVMLFILGFMVLWLSYDEVLINPPYRARYLLAIPVYVGLSWAVFKVWLPAWPQFINWPGRESQIAWGLGILAAGFMLTVSVYVFQEQARLAAMITPESQRALAVVPEGETAIGTNSFTMSLWVAALKRVDAPHIYTAPPPPFYREMDRDMRCVLGWSEGCNPYQSARSLGVEYILIDERFPNLSAQSPPNYMAPVNQWEVTANTPWLELAYSEGNTRLWKISNLKSARRP